METFAVVMMIIPLVLFVLPGKNNWGRELPKLVIWYGIFGSIYLAT